MAAAENAGFRVAPARDRTVTAPMKVAFISGTSIVNSTLFSAWETVKVETNHGPVTFRRRGDHVLLNRHGFGVPLPPHSINHRAKRFSRFFTTS